MKGINFIKVRYIAMEPSYYNIFNWVNYFNNFIRIGIIGTFLVIVMFEKKMFS